MAVDGVDRRLLYYYYAESGGNERSSWVISTRFSLDVENKRPGVRRDS